MIGHTSSTLFDTTVQARSSPSQKRQLLLFSKIRCFFNKPKTYARSSNIALVRANAVSRDCSFIGTDFCRESQCVTRVTRVQRSFLRISGRNSLVCAKTFYPTLHFEYKDKSPISVASTNFPFKFLIWPKFCSVRNLGVCKVWVRRDMCDA